jgi:N-acetylglucosaminylphosphatidylinositol deacetylase
MIIPPLEHMRLTQNSYITTTSSSTSDYRDCFHQQRPLVSLSADIFLLVIAHPDDECMFFIPTIVNLIRSTQTVFHILCLSNGNYEGLGKQREKELYDAVRTLGLDTHQVTVLTDFQDNPLLDWNDQLLSDCIYRHILYILSALQGSAAASSRVGQHQKTLTILTFDSMGVSGHRNHCSTYR